MAPEVTRDMVLAIVESSAAYDSLYEKVGSGWERKTLQMIKHILDYDGIVGSGGNHEKKCGDWDYDLTMFVSNTTGCSPNYCQFATEKVNRLRGGKPSLQERQQAMGALADCLTTKGVNGQILNGFVCYYETLLTKVKNAYMLAR